MKTLFATALLTAVSLPLTFAAQAPASTNPPSSQAAVNQPVKTVKTAKRHHKNHKKSHVAAQAKAVAAKK